jgi:hypothetical protein
VVADARKILHTTTPDEDDGVLLKVMPFPWDVGCDLEAIGQADAGNLSKRRVRLLWCGGINPGTHTALLRIVLEGRRLVLGLDIFPAAPDELIDSRHNLRA